VPVSLHASADLTIYRFVLQIPFRQFRPLVNVAADRQAISAKNKRETDNVARLSIATISAAMNRRCRASDETRREFIKVPAGPPSVNAALMPRRA
jgi:hypothetical protein